MCKRLVVLLCATFLFATLAIAADDFYYVGQESISVEISDDFIAVQFDSSVVVPSIGTFISGKDCLSDAPEPEYLDRGFYVIALSPNCSYSQAAGGLMSDPVVYRVAPVYLPSDSIALPISDLVSVEFDHSLDRDSVVSILTAYNLTIADSSPFISNLFWTELEDTSAGGPLEIGNDLHELDQTIYACATFYAEPVPAYVPSDTFFYHQYNFHNTGQTGGTADADIDADSAWEVAMAFGDPSMEVVVLDMGIESHEDLPSSRITDGYDAMGDSATGYPEPDWDPTPGIYQNHGIACAGLIAASHNDTGVVGLVPNIRIRPVKIYDDEGHSNDRTRVIVNAIDYAADSGNAVIISNSWSYYRVKPLPDVYQAIVRATSTNENRNYSNVVVFSAGNFDWNAVAFPANMAEVIAVGATDKNDEAWDYSNYGDSLDVVAPSGDLRYSTYDFRGDVWTIDQMMTKGWNPHYSGWDDGEGNLHYTGKFGGTSAACPQVAGIAAMILSRRPDFYTDAKYWDTCHLVVRNIIEGSAEDLGDAGWDPYYGHGRLNAFRALFSVSGGIWTTTEH